MTPSKKWLPIHELKLLNALESIGFQPANQDDEGDDEPTTEHATRQARMDYMGDLI